MALYDENIKCKLEALSTKTNTFLRQTDQMDQSWSEVGLLPRCQGNMIGKDRLPARGGGDGEAACQHGLMDSTLTLILFHKQALTSSTSSM